MKTMMEQYPVTDCCRALEVSRSGYYAWQRRAPSKRDQANTDLAAEIQRIFVEFWKCYGSPRVTRELRQRGRRCGKNRVAMLMRQNGLRVVQRRCFRPQTTDSSHDYPIAPNRLAQQEAITRTDQVWVGDITYVPTDEGWLYVAGIVDACSRRVVGWAMSDRPDTRLPLDALRMALAHRRPPQGLLHHSDRGCQYASEAYRAVLIQCGLQPSMSRKGNCYDNAMMESFWASLKKELIHRRRFSTRAEAYRAIFEYIEVFYNRVRLHSSLGYRSPVDFETMRN